jgi:hypothetical protein
MRDELFLFAFLFAIGGLLCRYFQTTISFILGEFSFERKTTLDLLNSKREKLQAERTSLERDLNNYQNRTQNVSEKISKQKHIVRHLLEIKSLTEGYPMPVLSRPIPISRQSGNASRQNLEYEHKRVKHELRIPKFQSESLSRNELIRQQDIDFEESVRIDTERDSFPQESARIENKKEDSLCPDPLPQESEGEPEVP